MATNKKQIRNFILLALMVLVLVVAGKKFSGDKAISVRATEVKARDIQETVLASGKIFPKTEVKISSDVSGEVVELYVKEGDTVRAGQLLARVNPDSYESAVERARASVNSARAQEANARAQAEGAKARKIQAEAQLDQVQAQYDNAKRAFERSKKLHEKGVISQSELETAQTSLASAEANLKSARAAVASATAAYNSARESVRAAGYNVQNALAGLKEMRTSLRKTSIRAPMTGILSSLSIEKGERVVGTIQMAGTEMMRISDFSVMEAQVDVSETNVLQVEVGDTAEIEIDAYPDRKFRGTVSEIGNSAANLSGLKAATDQAINFTVKIKIDPASYQDLIRPGRPFPLRPGMSASAEIFTHKVTGVPAVPLTAVTTREKEEGDNADDRVQIVVFRIDGDTVSMLPVKTGIQDDEYIQIISGVKVGDKVVSGPGKAVSRTLKNGMRVKVMHKKDKTKQ